MVIELTDQEVKVMYDALVRKYHNLNRAMNELEACLKKENHRSFHKMMSDKLNKATVDIKIVDGLIEKIKELK